MTASNSRFGSANRISIAHLLVWLTVVAMLLALRRTTMVETKLLPGVVGVLDAAFTGIALTGMFVVIWRCLVNHVAVDAGEWLLFVLGIILLKAELIPLLPNRMSVMPLPVANGLVCLATVLPTLSRKLEAHWKLFFGAAVVTQAAILVLAMLNAHTAASANSLPLAIERIQLLIFTTVPLLFVACQWNSRSDRNSLHWTGVFLFCGYMCAQFFARLS